MRKYNGSRELETVICNHCGKKLAVKDGILREGAFCADYTWDYFSEKDGDRHRWDLCEACYDELMGEFKIPPEVEELTELL